ncbi:MAG: DUF2474 domain-containing protein [Beijerinckiaceae bacterium]|nr:DUF2474 domain-containing protein [Beijerinckiaceae bacterium]
MEQSSPAKVPTPEAGTGIWKKLGWFVGIWIASILALAVVAYGIKLFLK